MKFDGIIGHTPGTNRLGQKYNVFFENNSVQNCRRELRQKLIQSFRYFKMIRPMAVGLIISNISRGKGRGGHNKIDYNALNAQIMLRIYLMRLLASVKVIRFAG